MKTRHWSIQAFYGSWQRLVILLGSSLVLAISFNNCADQNFSFELTDKIKRQRINEAKILIENGAEYVQRVDVLISIEGEEINEMYLTLDSSCESGGVWEPFASLRPWALAKRNDENRVYGKFRSREDIVSECISDAIVHDDISPVAEFISKPAAEIGVNSVNLEIAASDNLSGIATLECRENGSPFFSKCGNLLSRPNLREGSHGLVVRAKDKAGNVSREVSAQWLVDLTPPTLSIIQTPAKLSGDRQPRFDFLGADALTSVERYECRPSHQATFTPCSRPHVYQIGDVREGQNKFLVRAVDRVGNISTEQSYDWQVDLTAPAIQITRNPGPFVNSVRAQFDFVGTDRGVPIVNFACKVDASSYADCKSPYIVDLVNDGEHVFYLTAKDDLGNQAQPVSYKWTLDRVRPQVVLESLPDPHSNRRDATITYRASDQGSAVKSVACALDGNPVACSKSSLMLTNLAEGRHRISVVATDEAGNTSDPANYEWTIDLTAPVVKIVNGPSGYLARTAASVEFSGSDAGSGIGGFECKLDAGNFLPCNSPVDFANLRSGSHAISVVAIDRARNRSQPATVTWTVDLAPPTIHFVQKPVDQDYRLKATVELSVKDTESGLKTISCTLNGVPEVCSANFKKEYDVGVGNYIFKVVAEDVVGNVAENSMTWMETDLLKEMQKQVAVSDASVDILFVVDNSGSMAQEHKNMAQRIANFVEKLDRLDWQIAMTTTDPTSWVSNGDGRLLSFRSGKKLLKSSDPVAEAQADLSATIQMSTNGSGSEQGIYATYRSLERATAGEEPNRTFIRSTAHLSVVLISDEDESASGAKNMPDNLISYVKNTWGGKKMLQFHSIIYKPGDTTCSTGHTQGYRYREMSAKTGGIEGSVCELDYGALLAKIGDGVRNLITAVELDCQPQDLNRDGVVDIMVSLQNGMAPPAFSVSGNKLIFANPLPNGSHSVTYYCLKAP